VQFYSLKPTKAIFVFLYCILIMFLALIIQFIFIGFWCLLNACHLIANNCNYLCLCSKQKPLLARSTDGSQIMRNDIKVGDAFVTKQPLKHEAPSPPISAMKRYCG
jgi:hypothetical protein